MIALLPYLLPYLLTCENLSEEPIKLLFIILQTYYAFIKINLPS